jgi:hypothetical protein
VEASGAAAGESFAWTTIMLWLVYVAWWVDLIGLVPGASPEARLLPVKSRDTHPS